MEQYRATKSTQPPLVIYHYPCADGFTAAWAAWRAHPDWEFYPAQYGKPAPDVTGRIVYMLDFSYKRPIILEMAAKAKNIIILDHHKTAEEDLVDLPENVLVLFDMTQSGAQLAWGYFNQAKEPLLVSYVADRDLWKFELWESKAASSYIFAHEYDFNTWNTLYYAFNDNFHAIVEGGRAINAKLQKDIKELAVNQFTVSVFEPVDAEDKLIADVPAINVPYTYASDMANYLAQDKPFAISFYYDGSRAKFIFSLRSTETGMDVSAIAKLFGGWGHKHAAGFELPRVRGKEVFGGLLV